MVITPPGTPDLEVVLERDDDETPLYTLRGLTRRGRRWVLDRGGGRVPVVALDMGPDELRTVLRGERQTSNLDEEGA